LIRKLHPIPFGPRHIHDPQVHKHHIRAEKQSEQENEIIEKAQRDVVTMLSGLKRESQEKKQKALEELQNKLQ
jgi:hypothetical protein